MFKRAAIVVFLCAAAGPGQALTCDELKATIDEKIRASGVASFSLAVVDAAASAAGKTVGSCDNGRKRIAYTAAAAAPSTAAAASSPAKPRPAARPTSRDILTECKAGFSGPDCKPDKLRDKTPGAGAGAEAPLEESD